MNRHLDVDRVLEDWLEEGPSRLPDRVVDATIASLDEIEQQRPSWPLGRHLMQRMIIPATAAGAVLVGVVALLSWQGVGTGSGIGDVPEQPEPFVSERHHYVLHLPDDSWTVRELPGEWPLGYTFSESGPGVDRVETADGEARYILFNSQLVPEGLSFEEWFTDYEAAGLLSFRHWELEERETATVDGEVARISTYLSDDGQRGVEAVMFHGTRAYVFRVFGAVAYPGFDPANPRPFFDEWLARFEFTD